MPERVGRTCGVDQSLCVPSVCVVAVETKMYDGLSTKVVLRPAKAVRYDDLLFFEIYRFDI